MTPTPKLPHPALGTVAHAEVVAALTKAIRDLIAEYAGFANRYEEGTIPRNYGLGGVAALGALARTLGLTIDEAPQEGE